VIEKRLMSLEDAVRSMTSLPAAKFHLPQRGTIAEGNFADIAVIDLDTIIDRATFESPVEYAEGIVHLLVNGALAIEDRVATGVRAGVTLRRT
jgi:N-acyl-D-amino-acid deacylase